MSSPLDLPHITSLQLYLTAAFPCSYLEGRTARSQVATPSHLITTPVYSALVRQGFRRSGIYTYRPRCDQCHACIPVRLPIRDFTPSRSQRRAWKQHAGLQASILPLQDSEESFHLYKQYQAVRHSGGDMDCNDHEQFRNFLLQSQINSFQVEFRDAGELRMVSILDRLDDGLSAVYTYYDPAPGNSYGVYNILWQAALCRELGLDYLYLGYWIRDSAKMNYKERFKPLQGLQHGQWLPIEQIHASISKEPHV